MLSLTRDNIEKAAAVTVVISFVAACIWFLVGLRYNNDFEVLKNTLAEEISSGLQESLSELETSNSNRFEELRSTLSLSLSNQIEPIVATSNAASENSLQAVQRISDVMTYLDEELRPILSEGPGRMSNAPTAPESFDVGFTQNSESAFGDKMEFFQDDFRGSLLNNSSEVFYFPIPRSIGIGELEEFIASKTEEE